MEKGGFEGLSSNINSCLKALEIIKRTRSFAQNAELQGSRYFDMINIQGIKSEVSVRSFTRPEFEEVIDNYKTMFEGFKEVLQLSHLRSFGHIFTSLESFMRKDYNILVRAYLVNNLLAEPYCYF